MMSYEVIPVILCGGSGTRLWPLSRAGFPKQFLCLTGDESLFQQAARRFAGLGASDIDVSAPLNHLGQDCAGLGTQSPFGRWP
jgi:mannose-1-phosphate guanylyltransferase/mannose-6-phosphate isomerase